MEAGGVAGAEALDAAVAAVAGPGCGAQLAEVRRLQGRAVKEQLHLEAGAMALLSNGRLLPVATPGKAQQAVAVVAEDFQLLQMLATSQGPSAAIAKLMQSAYAQGRLLKDVPAAQAGPQLDSLVASIASVMASMPYPESRMQPGASAQIQQILKHLQGRAVEVASPPGVQSPFHITAILNPLSRVTQRISQVLQLLRSCLGPRMSLYLNPPRDLQDLPLKAFYRYALPEFQGLAEGGPRSRLPSSPVSYLARLPRKRVLTVNMDVPEPWLVEPTAAIYDLDNLRLADIPDPVVYAEYDLEHLLLTGSCVEEAGEGRRRATATRGLQLHLGTPLQPTAHRPVDTLVMSNLAYFQLKAHPGSWELGLAPGRSREIYAMVSSSGASHSDEASDLPLDDLRSQVLIDSFSGKHMVLRVKKREGMEKEDVLKDAKDPQGSGVLGSISSLFSGGKAVAQAKKEEVVNVFTVASGHMYERLQKIMILSVIKNTKARVKFWIIKNYMSPHHKEVVPRMAAEFGFDYEFVTYKWPHWLHKQTDKQRIIWAYKILFLDVLFPLTVDRIIFVDSDQVVRTDLLQLMNMDIGDAPLAYTPFCDNNREMDEYRFWKGGFWKEHLQGKPYHISALYLVDVKRLRAMAAGDQFRIIYEQLSKDPNSLANLDQDLPNYAQHSVPIFSLPQEWLWCESWCGNETKPQARTIDLCNNPKTKEPKLSAARRIITEWNDLDREQDEFTKRVDVMLAEEKEGFAPSTITSTTTTDPSTDSGATSPPPPAAAHDASEL